MMPCACSNGLHHVSRTQLTAHPLGPLVGKLCAALFPACQGKQRHTLSQCDTAASTSACYKGTPAPAGR
jgi:hypothetical protein